MLVAYANIIIVMKMECLKNNFNEKTLKTLPMRDTHLADVKSKMCEYHLKVNTPVIYNVWIRIHFLNHFL